VKLAGAQVERFLKAPDPRQPVVLLYGPDEGLVRERALTLVGAVLDDPNDPFRMSELAADSLRGDPARLADEAQALCLLGGRRVVRVRQAADFLAPACRALLGLPAVEALVLVEAGDLPKSSALRKLVEPAANAAAIPCYRDEGRDLAGLIDRLAAAEGLRLEPEARIYLVQHLGGDRGVTRAEIAKLALYVGAAAQDAGQPRAVTLDEAAAVIGDSAALGLDDLVHAATLGQFDQLQRCLDRLLGAGEAPVRLLRAAANHLARLHRLRLQADAGANLPQLIERSQPPIHFRRRPDVHKAVQRWPGPALRQGLDRLLQAEIACKTTGRPADLMCREALLAVCRRAAAARG
jgi:DNA polymerase-3 subunit delta